MKKAYFIPEKTTLSQQLVEFKNNNQKTGFAVDEYGNIQGLITIEDIFEEIVGDYLEETKKLNKEMKPKRVGDHFVVNASSNIRVLNKMMSWDIPVDEAKTINGAILENLGYGVSIDCLSSCHNQMSTKFAKRIYTQYIQFKSSYTRLGK